MTSVPRRSGSSSFADFLAGYAPRLLPGRGAGQVAGAPYGLVHGTTVLAAVFAGGVVMAGDRRATAGNVIAQHDLRKVLPADEFSAVAFAGVVGVAQELVRLFQVELEHYEKIEGHSLSLDGKANRLATMVRANLPAAMQGLAVVPLFAGFDVDAGQGRIFGYDISGDVHEARQFEADGSGSMSARSALKKLYRPEAPEPDAIRVCLEALYDAAEDDSATAGPNLIRQVFPTVAVVDANGYRALPDDEVAATGRAVVAARMERPDGPRAAW